MKKCPYCGREPSLNAVPLTEMFNVTCMIQFDHWISVYGQTPEEAQRKWNEHFTPKTDIWSFLKFREKKP